MGRRRAPLSAELRELSARMSVVAAGSGGVVTAAECRELGADRAAIRLLLGTGLWGRTRRGVYIDRGFAPRVPDVAHHARCAALLAALGASAVVSHVSAVRLLGLPLPPRVDGRVSITRRAPAPSNDPAWGDVHVDDYDDADVIEVDGVALLAGSRLVLDCCAVLSPDSALAVADAALARRITTVEGLRRSLRERAGRPGLPVARLVAARADPLAESWFESASRWWLLAAGLPRPRLQVPFHDERGVVRARVDMLIGGVVGEADGAGKYTDPGALYAEKQREDWLRHTHRLEVVRWVPHEMRTPQARETVVTRFQQAFDRAA